MNSTEFAGGVFSKTLAEGRAGATLQLNTSGVSAQTAKGESFSIPFSNLEFEIGGQKGAMVFCRHAKEDLTFYTDDPQFTNAVLQTAPPQAASQLKSLVASQKKKRAAYRWFLMVAMGLGILLIFFMHEALGPLVDKGIKSLPYEVDQKLGELAINNMDLGGEELQDPRLRNAMDIIFKRL